MKLTINVHTSEDTKFAGQWLTQNNRAEGGFNVFGIGDDANVFMSDKVLARFRDAVVAYAAERGV